MSTFDEFVYSARLSQMIGPVWTTNWAPFDTGSNDLWILRSGRSLLLSGLVRISAAGTSGTAHTIVNLAAVNAIPNPTFQTANAVAYGSDNGVYRMILTTAGLLQVSRPTAFTPASGQYWSFALPWLDLS